MIFVFSATGNTKWAAEEIASKTGERVVALPVNETSDLTLAPEESVGFFFPVHAWRVPGVVEKFVKNCSIDFSNRYCYLFLTSGDDCGEIVERFESIASPKGMEISAAYWLKMPNTYVGIPFMDVDTKEVEMAKLAKAKEEISLYAEKIKNKEKANYVRKGILSHLKTSLIGGFFQRYLIDDKRFKVQKDKCIGCGVCEKKCPVADIVMENGMPKWINNGECMTCFSCYHYCPQHAIVFNNQKNKGQYHK